MLRMFSTTIALFGLALLLGLGAAAPSLALDDLDPATATVSAGECPALTRVKYPWLVCRANPYGGVELLSPGEPKPLRCHLLMPSGECAADPRVWRFETPEVRPGPAY